MEVLPGGLEVSDLPNEIQQLIIGKLPTEDLFHCRLVSKLWKSLATGLCRQRHVQLRHDWLEDGKGMEIFKVFDPDDLPWSSFALSDLPSQFSAITEPFMEMFGSHLWETTIPVDHSLVTKWLGMTPNLRKIVVGDFGSFTEGDDDDDEETIQLEPGSLSMLKKVEVVHFGEQVFPILRSLLIAAPQLKHIVIWSLELGDDYSAEMASYILDNFPIIDITHQSETSLNVFNSLATCPLRIRKLPLCLSPSALKNWKGCLSRLNLEYLKTLELEVPFTPGELNPSYKFPKLVALKHLIIDMNAFPDNSSANFTRDIFSRMDSQEFPVLERVDIRGDWDKGFQKFALFNPSSCFETVTELELFEKNFLEDNWIHLFPNLTKLEIGISGLSLRMYPFIFSIQKLQSLGIWISTPYMGLGDDTTDLNVLLSGIEDPDSLYLESEEVIAKYRETHPNPSFHQLTELKKLKIVYEGADLDLNRLGDAAASLTFLNMHKLDLLLFQGLVISDECAAKLRAHHSNFVTEAMED